MSADEQPEKMSGPGAGLSATGRHADDFRPGGQEPGTDYGSSSGIGTDAEVEDAAAPASQDSDTPGAPATAGDQPDTTQPDTGQPVTLEQTESEVDPTGGAGS